MLSWFSHFYESYFPESDTRHMILDLSYDPIWAIWLYEVSKYHHQLGWMIEYLIDIGEMIASVPVN